ncbi:hypothetical protein [Paraburkholderia fungorum]|uniref:Uncharacterized protein n=1 Tax=Paraburkholderia fungorum TaxID=134537 RepID=A0AAW3V1I6_9BURK|nr:hypothetical protein [Paraburkholderia fungorum]MBB4517435.1 hypothetical protein [Paraburkholderia fungorum]MBB6204503.1 hypothetical protein [Paraburkholderia fungorum]
MSSASRLKPVLPTVSVGSDSVVIRRSGQSSPVIAGILGQFTDDKGDVTRVVLDRVVHRLKESEFEGWRVCGAVVTELHRKAAEEVA